MADWDVVKCSLANLDAANQSQQAQQYSLCTILATLQNQGKIDQYNVWPLGPSLWKIQFTERPTARYEVYELDVSELTTEWAVIYHVHET